MSLDDLIGFVFEQGCGIKRSTARRSPRYKKLLKEPHKLDFVGKRRVAEITLLGERLADRAFRNLPKNIRDAAPGWKQLSSKEQRLCAEKMVHQLFESWHRRSAAHSNDLLEVALPQMYGSWTRGKFKPNCLGMAQMLVGWARQTGVQHHLVTVIRQSDSANERLFYKVLLELQENLQPFRHIKEIDGYYLKLEGFKHRSLTSLAYHHSISAHHALLIRAKRGWMLIDPHLDFSYTIDGSKNISLLLRQLANRPTRVIKYKNAQIPLIDRYIGSLSGFDEAIASLAKADSRAKQQNSVLGVAMIIGAYMAYGDKKENIDVGLINDLKSKRLYSTFVYYMNSAYNKAYFPVRRRKVLAKATAKERRAAISKAKKRAEENENFRVHCMARLVGASINNVMSWAVDALRRNGKSVHPVIELAHPTYALGLATLNHVAVKSQEHVPELVLCSSSQWILHDTLDAVEKCGTARQRYVAANRLRRLSREDKATVLPQLLPYLERGVKIGQKRSEGVDT